jgi:hypothetical protein
LPFRIRLRRPFYRPKTRLYETVPPMTTDTAEQASALRAELKAWEKAFAAKHSGRRAGREDIKADAEICTDFLPGSSNQY